MKFTLKNSLMKQLIKEEAKSLKKDLMTSGRQSRLDEIKSKREEISAIISEMYESEELEELFGMGKFSKAKKAYLTKYQNEIAQLKQAYKAKDLAYIEISSALVKNLGNDLNELIRQFGFSDRSDIQTLKTTIMEIIQPMSYKTFRSQAEGGISIKDFAGGTSSQVTG